MAGPSATQGSAFLFLDSPLAPYNKPYLSVSDQIVRLEDRGMTIPDRQKAEEYLSRIGYYRLSAYWYPFRATAPTVDGTIQVLDTFKPSTSFKTVVDLYAFDKALRLHLLDALERIEISVRTSIALRLGVYDPLAHRNSSLLDGKFAKLPDPRPAGPSIQIGFVSWTRKQTPQRRNSQFIFGPSTAGPICQFGSPLSCSILVHSPIFLLACDGRINQRLPVCMGFLDQICSSVGYAPYPWFEMSALITRGFGISPSLTSRGSPILARFQSWITS